MTTAKATESWQSKASRAQRGVLDSIPAIWKLPSGPKSLNEGRALAVPADCGILSAKQLEITALTASELLQRIHSGKLSSVEATEAFCARAAIAHQLVNCLTEFFPEEGLETAKRLDEYFAATGEPIGPLHGLPMCVKDIQHLKGHKVTMAWVAWLDNPASDFDSAPVTIMRDAGAVFFGRTTLPQTGMALETVSNLWGRTLNPYNSIFGAGGSSGGDAALTAMHGEPASPLSSDIGGSIRAPAAFNGLYAMRPTAERVPRAGLTTVAPGNVSIKVSSGPCCHAMADVKLFVKLLCTHPTLPYEPTSSIPYWKDQEPPKKLRVGLLETDGVVEPHPPILRAMRETAAKLQAEGHEVFDISQPLDLWEAALVTWKLYFQTGAEEAKSTLRQAGEPPIKQFAHNLEVFGTKPLTVLELFQCNVQQSAYKVQFQKFWDTHADMDCILCPVAPAAGVPHDFPLWWGYTTIWNLLDYPSVVMPVKDLVITAVDDPKDAEYKPRINPFDKANWELYDPDLWKTQPVTLQLVGRPWRDEYLIAVAGQIDRCVNGTG